MKIDKWTGILLRIRKEAVAQCRVQCFGRSRCKTARSLRIAFPNFRHGSAVPRARAHAGEPTATTQTMCTHLMRAARTLLRSEWWFLR